ncbi:cysteine desulfurase family protein [Aureibaculum sp. 2210JD6-5]|uniref:cysteine desulfurase family protein n=1 Tax=Aureibaculum sp. 2210JD6-5 TaxID=3103957 RepID=UPI002AACE026|nr:cysteine desulfurase family protein [Aureibaculum sp. 2210JD6-5]MDY7395070.1 cysteine desulfurase family protein [Aureibaculum sp. 2210JD6-5]
MSTIYLDNAATTPIDANVIERITEVMTTVYGNPSSTHQLGRKAKVVVEEARKSIAKHFNVSAGEVFFTAGGSEADNLILRNAIVNLGVKRIITTKIEHHAVLHTVEALMNEFNLAIDFVDLDEKGMVDYIHLEALLEDNFNRTLVSLMSINNELGNLLDIKKVSGLCIANNALFHSDTVQAIGHFKMDLQKTPIDFITASAHKFHGPKGVGFAIIKKGFGIKPILIGGEQERGARAGTENVPQIAGMQTALDIALENLEADRKHITELKKYFIDKLKGTLPNVEFNGCSADLENSTYTILNVRFPKTLPMLLFQLDLKGIAASGGSACQSGSNKGSHVLNAILSEDEAKNTSVRFSFGKYNTKEEIDKTVEVLKGLV